MIDKLKAYKLDKAFTEGVEIVLDKAPDVVFVVKLPSQYNREYTQAVYGMMTFDMSGEEVTPKGNLLETRYAQEEAFCDYCIMMIDGEPVPNDFAEQYPEALTELMDKANQLANSLTNRVDDSVKKSSAFSTGNETGQGKKGSTVSLKAEAG